MEKANRLIPLGHGPIKSEKHEARLGPFSRSADDCSSSQRSDRKVQEKNPGASLHIINGYSKRPYEGQGGKIKICASRWHRLITCHQYS